MIHRAGPLDADKVQRCTRCGLALKDFRVRGLDVDADVRALAPSMGVIYPEGASVTVMPYFQAMDLQGEPDCQ